MKPASLLLEFMRFRLQLQRDFQPSTHPRLTPSRVRCNRDLGLLFSISAFIYGADYAISISRSQCPSVLTIQLKISSNSRLSFFDKAIINSDDEVPLPDHSKESCSSHNFQHLPILDIPPVHAFAAL